MMWDEQNPYGQDQNSLAKQRMAQMLMMSQQPQGQNGGLAGAGQSIANAIAMKNLMQQQDPENQVLQQRYGMNASQANGVLNPSLMSRIGNIFGMGGGS